MATSIHSFMDIFDAEFSVGEDAVQLKRITIPMVQRDYAQGRTDKETARIRARFLDSLHRAVTESPITLDFIYGDIDANGILTPLDGQQRLTTLFLLHWYAAKAGGVDAKEYAFLRRFRYETRYSARDFCSYLIDFAPALDARISEEIIDQAWFPLDWQKDATVRAMLVMLDDIQEKFDGVADLWEKLKGKAIRFYFLPIKDMGLTDELYIKMNSRGKALTAFEHFKAELEREARQVDEGLCRRLMRKIDLDWTDMLWNYRGGDQLIDDEFLRYFRFVCDIICYRNGGTMQGKRPSEFDLLRKFFTGKSREAKKNLLFLERFYDVWREENLGLAPAEFLRKFIGTSHEPGKIMLENKPDLLEDCLRNYADVYGGRNRAFPLNRIILLYAVIVYLLNKDAVTEKAFARRLRVVHNLARNSDDEISDSEQRASGNRMPAILRQVDSIILNGILDDSIESSFNLYQISEEKEKLQWVREHPEHAEQLFALEDHELLYGQIAVVGLEDPKSFARFAELFRCEKDAIDCALLVMGDYTQADRNGWRYQIGSKKIIKSWTNLFHRGAATGFEATKKALRRLLAVKGPLTDEKLCGITERYIAECEKKKSYDWRYYYVKYEDAFRPGRYGKIYWTDKEHAPYEMQMLHTELQQSENAYQPFLKLIDENALSREGFGQYLIVGDYWIECANDGFYLHNMSDDEVAGHLKIKQNEEGIDVENRVRKAIRWYRKLF